ncbi:18545_t:CDS:1 [Acaulospora morrowiae]|uniref:18545_t:CDS:1 n=1 Tax=Acaulospora morrowiae TaxID=94023 RepID=A0A9N8ZGW6_9GLOM|nr:18545_t:CDS:1 [Acaulospora morrowiae]
MCILLLRFLRRAPPPKVFLLPISRDTPKMNSRAIDLATQIQVQRTSVFPAPQQNNPAIILPLLTQRGSRRPYQGFHLFCINFTIRAQSLGEENIFVIRKAANHLWNFSTRDEKLGYSILAKQVNELLGLNRSM